MTLGYRLADGLFGAGLIAIGIAFVISVATSPDPDLATATMAAGLCLAAVALGSQYIGEALFDDSEAAEDADDQAVPAGGGT